MAIFEIMNATDSLIQNIIRIVSPVVTFFWYFNLKNLETMLNYAYQFIKIRLAFQTPYLWNEAGDPQFLFSFWNK